MVVMFRDMELDYERLRLIMMNRNARSKKIGKTTEDRAMQR